jgi:PKD repeat protein
VYVRDEADISRLTSGPWDVLESRGADYLLILGDETVAEALRAQGFRVEVDETIPAQAVRAPLTYYGGYRTVVEHEQHLAGVVAAHPDLARLIDYGDTWRKQQGRNDGHDLYALCLTRLRPGDCVPGSHTDKARFLLITGVHARELAPPELAWRWIDELVDGYGVDPEITAWLDQQELWVIPLVNPDGRSIVEQGGNTPILQRKNADTAYGNCVIPNIGVDLNRNANFKWGGPGSSSSPCDQIYRGPSADSEPETVALEALLNNLFGDQNGPELITSAPPTTTGIILNLHSDGNMAMIPWDWTSSSPPNNTELLSIVYRMSYFNGYRTGSSGKILYISSGTLDDWAYGQLGIPTITFEVADSWTPSYASINSTHWPINRGALRYAAKIARQPYTLSFGPSALTPALSLSRTLAGTPVTLTAWMDDQPYGTVGEGRPLTQPISQAAYTIDELPWAGGTPIPLRPLDGSLNSPRERMVANVDTCLSAGRHTLYVHGRDTSGYWGPTTETWLYVTSVPSYTLSGTVTNRLSGAPLAATLRATTVVSGMPVIVSTTADPATGFYSLAVAGAATYSVTVTAPAYAPETRMIAARCAQGTEHFTLRPEAYRYTALLPVTTHYPVIAPTANFTATPLSGFAPLTVTFTNLSSGDYSSSLWEFGDGTTSMLQHPTHAYTAAGVYTISLTVSGPDGANKLTRISAVSVSSVTFHWLDATAGGTIVARGDDTSESVALSFPFTFYGNAYTRTFVSSNGFISFGSGYSSYAHGCLPSPSIPNNAIYAMWDDLAPTGGSNGNVYVKAVDADTFVIEWYAVAQFGTTISQTFEIVLRRDNSILLQYHTVSDTSSATVGVENLAGTAAQQFRCNGAGLPLTNSLVLRVTTASAADVDLSYSLSHRSQHKIAQT